MEKLPTIMTDFLYKQGVIEEEEMEICKYGIQISLANLFNFCIAFGIGLIFQALVEIGIFYIVFVSLRFFCGGYHADSYGKCFSLFAVTCIGYLAMLGIFAAFGKNIDILLAAALTILGICILKKAPIEHSNRPFSEGEKRRFRKRSIQLYLLWSVIGIILCVLRAERLSAGLTSVFIIISVYMIVGRRSEYEEEIA